MTCYAYDIIQLKTVSIVYKAYNKLLPHNIQMNFIRNENIHGHDFRTSWDFKIPFVRTKQNCLCASITGVKLWNQIHKDIKYSCKFESFQYSYKTNLLSKYSC